jgi:hypothetical protein
MNRLFLQYIYYLRCEKTHQRNYIIFFKIIFRNLYLNYFANDHNSPELSSAGQLIDTIDCPGRKNAKVKIKTFRQIRFKKGDYSFVKDRRKKKKTKKVKSLLLNPSPQLNQIA